MSFGYKNQDPPLMDSEDGRRLAEWLGRELRGITSAFDTVRESLLTLFVGTAYGGLGLETPTAIPGTIPDTGYVTVPFDSGAVTSPRFVTQDPTNNRWSYQLQGIYYLTLTLNFTHDESTGSREVLLRLYNETDGVGFDPVTIGIGRNQPATNITVGILVEIPRTSLDKWFRFEIGEVSGSPISTVTITEWETAEMSTFQVSEYQGDL